MWSFLDIDEVGAGATDEQEEEPSASQMAGKSPNFCVLLHGSLKVEGMVAVVQLGWDNTRAAYIALLNWLMSRIYAILLCRSYVVCIISSK